MSPKFEEVAQAELFLGAERYPDLAELAGGRYATM